MVEVCGASGPRAITEEGGGRSGDTGGRRMQPYYLRGEQSATITQPKGDLRRATRGQPRVQMRAGLTGTQRHKLVTSLGVP